ncbi:MAG: hypothetical protein ABL959_06610 [Pyrinomonadaceae bacterium]
MLNPLHDTTVSLNPPKRPASVWLGLFLLSGISVAYIVVPIVRALFMKSVFDYYGVGDEVARWELTKNVLAEVAYVSPLIVAAIIGFLGLMRRWRFARWWAVVFFALVSLLAVIELFLVAEVAGDMRDGTSSLAQIFKWLNVCLIILFLFTAIRFSTGRSERVYFSWTPPDSGQAPPPPPTFNE